MFRHSTALALFLLNFNASAKFDVELACDAMPQNLQAVKKWTNSRHNKTIECELNDPAFTRIEGKNLCRANLENCLPREVLDYHWTNSKQKGPNCFNLALVMAGILPARRYSSESEMTYFMESPLCRKLAKGEKPQPGDIGAIRSQDKEVHGFMWISEDLVFSKGGWRETDPYLLQNFKFMNDAYKALQEQQCAADPQTSSCETFIDSYRCQSLDSYLKNSTTQVPTKIKDSFEKLNRAEHCFSSFQFQQKPFRKSQFRGITDSIAAVAAAIDSEDYKIALSKMPDDEQKFLKGITVMRLNTMWVQNWLNESHSKDCGKNCEMVSKSISNALQKVDR